MGAWLRAMLPAALSGSGSPAAPSYVPVVLSTTALSPSAAGTET